MTCEHIREDLVETARARELSSDIRAMVFAHTARCPDCEVRLAREVELSRALGVLAMSTDGAPARTEQFLLRQLPTPIRARSRRWSQVMIAGAAAALLAGIFLISTVFGHRNTPPSIITTRVASQQAPAKRVPDLTVASTQTSNTVKRSLTHSITGRARRAPIRTAPEVEPFVALPYAATLLDTEQSEWVRIRMPREALLSVGVPVSVDHLGEEVLADVVLGMDGTPRAIRLAN